MYDPDHEPDDALATGAAALVFIMIVLSTLLAII
jgi:hypothetical protein